MNILGICDSQDAGVAWVNNKSNDILALNEERISRVKLSGGFPLCSIKEILRLKNHSSENIDLVVIASHMTPSFILRIFPHIHAKLRNKNKQFSLLLSLYILYQVIAGKTILLKHTDSFLSRFVLKRKLKKLGIDSDIVFIDHHIAHAYGAYSTSGFDKALIFTIDGLGDGISFTVNIGNNGKVKRIFKQNALNDITLYYSRLTEFLGFIPIQDEGKVMGLAAYSSNYSVLEEAEKLLHASSGRFKTKNTFSKDKKIYNRLKNKSKEEIAASFQLHVENVITAIVRFWIKKTGISNVVLSGGFFANIKVNQKIMQLNEVKNIYIYPHMGDGGLALGAIFAATKTKSFRLKNLFLGPECSNEQILKVLEKSKIKYEFFDNIEQKIAYILSQGKIVARFCGAMEYGPRALGNRSVLCQAIKVEIKDVLNAKLGRDKFMPFAPAILFESRHDCCLNVAKAEYTANFMNISFDATEYFKKACPAVVHKDETTRPQFVSKENNRSFYKIIDEYRKFTGIPAIINTSFNIHEEPIVYTPEDALRVFRKTKLDYLALENFLIKGGDL